MKKIFLLLFAILILLGSCNDKTQKQIEEISDKNSLTSTISSSNMLLIRPKKSNQTESTRSDSCFDIALYKAKENQIEDFKKLFDNSIYTDYCCCPQTNLSIDFYKDSKKIDHYFVDTVEFKNQVRIFEKSYQFSFLVEKHKWENYLKEINAE